MADKTQYYELEKTNPVKPTNLNTQIDNNLVKIDTVMHENSVKAEGKQDKLVSGTNIKTINSQSILGSGDIVITGGSAVWGGITGTITNQTDLVAELNKKENQLVAGANITLDRTTTPGKTIIASTGGPGQVYYAPTVDGTAYQYTTKKQDGTIGWESPDVSPLSGSAKLISSDAVYDAIEAEKTRAQTKEVELAAGLLGKQDKLPTIVADRYLHTNSETGNLEWKTVASSEAKWGSITGTLNDQIDLKNALAGKQEALNTAQMNSVNSGITPAKVEAYDEYKTSKQDTLPTAVKGKFFHSNSESGDMEWADVPSEIDDALTSASDKTYSINKIIDLIQTMGSTFRGSFPTKADLDAYPGPMDENDIAIVQQDETHEQFATVYRYVSEVWTFQYEIKVAFTTSQWDAINSGVSKTWKANVEKSIEDEIVRAKSEEAKAIQLLGKEAGSGEEYHFTYFYDFEVKPDTITAHVDTITLDNKRTLKRFSKDLPGATFDDEGYFATAGLYNQTVEDAVNGKVTKLKTAVNTRMDGIEENLSNEITRAKNVESDLEANKISLLGKEAGSGEEYHFPFNVTGIKQELESIDVTFDTITLDNKKTIKGYTLSIPSADIFGNDKAGLFTVGINDDINMRIENAREALETSISIEVDRATARENELDTNKADKTALNDKISLLGNEIGSGEPYHFTYFYDVKPKSDGIGITIDTITLDNNKTLKKYDMTVPLANVGGNTAGLYGKSIDDTLVKHTEMVAMTSAEIDALIGGW